SAGWCQRRFRFFFHGLWPTEFSPLSLHDALPIYAAGNTLGARSVVWVFIREPPGIQQSWVRGIPIPRHGLLPASFRWLRRASRPDRKSTRLNSSHVKISYAAFCLKKKKSNPQGTT